MPQTFFRIMFCGLAIVVLGALFFYLHSSAAGQSLNISGFAWSSNYGWISFNEDNHRVNIVDNEFANGSYAWSPNIGWIAFGKEQLAGCPTAPCAAKITQVGNYRYASGWAKVLSTNSWISLNGKTTDGKDYGIVIQPNGAFTGYAWDNSTIGWISFQGVAANGSQYGVYTQPLALDDIKISRLAEQKGSSGNGGNVNGNGADVNGKNTNANIAQDCAFYAVPSQVTEFSNTTLYWYCSNVTACSLDGASVSVPLDTMKKTLGKNSQTFTLSCQGVGGLKNYTTEVKVLDIKIKEVKP